MRLMRLGWVILRKSRRVIINGVVAGKQLLLQYILAGKCTRLCVRNAEKLRSVGMMINFRILR